MPEPDLEDFAVDPSRVYYGVRRFWWVIALFTVAGAFAAVAASSSQSVFDVELRESASRTRARADVALLDFSAVGGVMNSPEQQAAVDARSGEAVVYQASATPDKFIAIRVVAQSEELARSHSADAVEVMNEWLSSERQEFLGQRVAELTQSTESLAARIDSIGFANGDDVTEILERSSLISLLVSDQSRLTQASSSLDQDLAGSTLVRTALSSSSGRQLVIPGAAAGALAGLAIAAGLGLSRRRIRDVTDLRRIVGNVPIFLAGSDGSPSAMAALVTGVVAELGGSFRSRTSFASVGASTGDLYGRMLQTSTQFGLGLEGSAEGEVDPADQVLTLVAATSGWDVVLEAAAGSSLLVLVDDGDLIADVADQMRLVRTSRLPLLGYVLVS